MARYSSSPNNEKFLNKFFLSQKLNNWVGYILILGIASVFGYLIANQIFIGAGLFGLVFGLAVVIICLLNAEAGLYINIVFSFFIFGFSRAFFDDNFPIGIVFDFILYPTFLGLFIQKTNFRQNLNLFIKTPVGIGIILLLFYLIIEFFNPEAKSFDGWYQTFRRIFESVILIFVAMNVFKDYAAVKRFLIVLFVLCVIVGLYGCIQEWFGFLDFETAWVMGDKQRFGLYFVNGHFRRFSSTSDPNAFGVLMAAACIIYIIIASEQKRTLYRVVLISGIIIMIMGMAYSGTRTANAMLLAGIGMYALLDFGRKRTRIFSVIAVILLLAILYVPYNSNYAINRFRSTFTSSKDESYQSREKNRKFIQPYIYSHPIGGGLGTCGAAGAKYNPGHYLAGFPPDSSYLRKAMETGWLGLALTLIVYFIITKYSIHNYFQSKNLRLKLLAAATTACIFSFYIAEFAQEAVGQLTDIMVYYPLVALTLRLKYFEADT